MTINALLDRLLELHAPAVYMPQPYQYTGCRVCRFVPGSGGGPVPFPFPCPTVELIEEFRDA